MTLGDDISTVVAVATFLMMVATFGLAWVTWQLASKTTDATKQADRHHQENLRPFCAITFADATRENPFGIGFDPEERRRRGLLASSTQDSQSGAICVRGELRNKGNGPALGAVVYLNARQGQAEDGVFQLTSPVLASGLIGAGETITVDVQITDRSIISIWNGRQWIPTQAFHAIAGQAYEVVLEYRDTFGNPFRTIHPRGIYTDPIPDVGDAAERERMMLRPDRPTPIFLTGKQVLRTLADAPGPAVEIFAENSD